MRFSMREGVLAPLLPTKQVLFRSYQANALETDVFSRSHSRMYRVLRLVFARAWVIVRTLLSFFSTIHVFSTFVSRLERVHLYMM